MRPAVWESDAIKQKELFDSYNQETIQPHLKKIEKQLEENGSGYLVGNEVYAAANILFLKLFS